MASIGHKLMEHNNAMKFKLVAVLAILLTVTLGFSSFTRAGQVVKNSYEDSFPCVKDDYVVWQGNIDGDWEIFLYNIAAQEFYQISDNDYGDISPQTDGNYVVWLGFSCSGGEIFLYDISSGETTQITNDTNVDSPPQIANGRVVWTSYEVTDSVEPGEIFLYDIVPKMTTPLSASVDSVGTLDDSSPRINDESVMWVQADDAGNTTLFMHYFGNGTEPAPEGFVWTDSPQADGDLTVLTRYDGSDREVLVYNASLKTYEQITDNDLEDRDPHISGNNIAWVGGEGNASEIFINSYVEPIEPTQPGSTRSSDNGLCFIATAAFGSPMETHVTILRSFRDRYLLPSAFGRIFVSAYNRYSPPLAQFIAKHEMVKVAVRISLLPVVAVSYAVLHFGPAVTLGMIIVLLILPIFLVSSYRRKASAIR